MAPITHYNNQVVLELNQGIYHLVVIQVLLTNVIVMISCMQKAGAGRYRPLGHSELSFLYNNYYEWTLHRSNEIERHDTP